MTSQTLSLLEQPYIGADSRAKVDEIFEYLDVSENTRRDYKERISLFLEFIAKQPLNVNSYLEYKRSLATRNDLAVSTKNKNLATARVFLKELNRRGILPADITQNVKSFAQDKKHKRDGLNDEEITHVAEKLRELPLTQQNARLRAIVALLG